MKEQLIKYIFKWSKEYLKRCRIDIIFIILLSSVLIVLNLCQVNFIQQIIDAALLKNWPWVLKTAAVFFAVSFVRLLRNYSFECISNRLEARVACNIKNNLISHILRVRLEQIETKNIGELLNFCNNDIEKISGFMRSGALMLFFNPLMSVCGFIYLFQYSWVLSLGVFLPVPFLALTLNYLSRRAGRIYEKGQRINSQYLKIVHDMIHGAETILANQMADRMAKKFDTVVHFIYENELTYYKNDGLTLAFIMSVTYVPNIITFLFGGWLAINGQIEISLLFAYAQLIGLVNTPVINLFSSLNELREVEKSMRRLDDILYLEREQGGKMMWRIADEVAIRCSHMSFSYNSEKEKVFEDFSFMVHRGTCLGIVGESGAGKTTLLNLLCGFYTPGKGEIRIFGHKTEDWNLDELRRMVAYVTQENQVIVGTVRENICFNAGWEDAETAARQAGLDEFVQTLPEKYETRMREMTNEWSGGQYQRLNLARALLRDAELYIFDEPTASLDMENEQLILQSIRKLKERGKTILIVSHCQTLLEICDEVLVLEKKKYGKQEYNVLYNQSP